MLHEAYNRYIFALLQLPMQLTPFFQNVFCFALVDRKLQTEMEREEKIAAKTINYHNFLFYTFIFIYFSFVFFFFLLLCTVFVALMTL